MFVFHLFAKSKALIILAKRLGLAQNPHLYFHHIISLLMFINHFYDNPQYGLSKSQSFVVYSMLIKNMMFIHIMRLL